MPGFGPGPLGWHASTLTIELQEEVQCCSVLLFWLSLNWFWIEMENLGEGMGSNQEKFSTYTKHNYSHVYPNKYLQITSFCDYKMFLPLNCRGFADWSVQQPMRGQYLTWCKVQYKYIYRQLFYRHFTVCLYLHPVYLCYGGKNKQSFALCTRMLFMFRLFRTDFQPKAA